MAEQDNPIDKLYSVVKERGLYTKSLEEFKSKYSNPENTKKLYDVISSEELYTKDFNSFNSKYFSGEIKLTKEQPLSNPNTLGTQPTVNTDVPTVLTGGSRNQFVKEQAVKKEDVSDKNTYKPSFDVTLATESFKASNKKLASTYYEDPTVATKREKANIIKQENEDNITASRNIQNKVSNFQTTLKALIPQTSLFASKVTSGMFDKSITNYLYSLPRLTYNNEDGFTVETGQTVEQVQQESLQRLDELGSQFKETLGVVDALKNPEGGKLISALAGTVLDLAGTALPAAVSGGSSIPVQMIGQSIYDYNNEKAKAKGITIEELYKTKQDDIYVPVLLGSAATALEFVGLQGMQNAISKNLTGNMIKKASLFTFEANKEGMANWLQLGLDKANTTIARGGSVEEASMAAGEALVSKEGLENYLQGVVGSGGAGLIGRVVSPTKAEQVSKLTDKNEALLKDLKSEGLDSDTKNTVVNQLLKNKNEQESIINAERDLIDNLPEDQQKSLARDVAELNSKKEAVKNENISDTLKETLNEEISKQEIKIEDKLQEAKQFKQQNNEESSSKNADGQNVNEENGKLQDGQSNGQEIQVEGGKPQGKNDGQNEGQNEVLKEVVTEEVGGATPTIPSPTEQVKQLRVDEQAEYDAMADPNDEANKKEIYDKYDKLITPLLEQDKASAVEAEPVSLQKELPKPDKAKTIVINNKITKQKAALARAVKDSRKQANIGFAGTRVIKELVKLGALYLEGGTVKFSEWSKAIIKEYGSKIEQKDLVDLYKKAAKSLKVEVIDNTVKKRIEKSIGVKSESKDESAFKQGNKQGRKEGKLEVQLNAQEKVDKVKEELQSFKDDIKTKFAEYTKFKTEENKAKLDSAKTKYADKLKQVKEKATQELKTFRDDVKTKFEEYNKFKNEQSKQALDDARQKAKDKIAEIRQLGKERFTEKITKLKESFKNKILDIKTSDLKDRAAIKQVRDFFSSFKKLGTFNGVKIPANIVEQTVKKLSTALASKDRVTAMMDFSEYLEKIIDDVDRTKKENVARQQSNKIKSIANSSASKGQIQQNPILKAFARIGANPSKITDIDNYNEIATQIDKNGITVSNKDLQNYIDKEIDAQAKVKETREKEIADLKEANLKKRMQELLDEAGIEDNVEDYYQEEVEYSDSAAQIRAEKLEQEGGELKETLTDKLKKVVEANRKGLPSNGEGLTTSEVQTLEALKGISLEGLTPTELKQINTAISNAVVNGDLITATMNITQKYIQEQELPKWVKFYQDGLKKVKKNGKFVGGIIQGTGQKSSKLTPKTGRGNTNQLFRAISNNPNVGQQAYDMVMSPMMRGKSEAKQVINRVKTGILKIVKGLDTVNRTRVGDAGYLLNFELDGRWLDKQEAFEAKKQELEDGIIIIEDKIRQAKQNLKDVYLDNLVQKLKDKTEALVEIRKYDDVETFQKEFLTPKERQLYDFIIKAYEEQKEATKLYYRKLGIKFTDSENFFPITFGGITSSDVGAQKEVGIDSYMGASALNNEGGFVAERTRKKGLPVHESQGIKTKMYVETDALLNFNREFGRRTIDLETMEGRVRAKHFLESKELISIMDDVRIIDGKPKATIDNMTNIVAKVNETAADILGTTPFSQDVDSIVQTVIDKLTTGFFNTALGSASQFISQAVPSVPVVIAQTSIGSWGSATKIQMQNTRLILDLMKESKSDAHGRLESPLEQVLQDKISKAKDEYQNGLLNTAGELQEFSNKLSFKGLTLGDNINTSNAWMAGYIQSLRDNNLVDSKTKFDEAFMQEQVSNPNLKASAYADMIASSVNAAMDTDTRATNLKKRSSSARALDIVTGNVLKGFTTSFNFEARLAMRSIFNGEGKARDYKFLAAYGSSIFLISPLVKLALGGAYEAGVNLVGGLFGSDDEDERRKAAERRSLEKLNIILTKEEKETIKNMKISPAEKAKKRAELIKEKYETVRLVRKVAAYLTQASISTLMGSKQGIIQGGVEFGLDRIYNKVVESQFQDGFNAVEQKISLFPRTLFFTSEDNIFGMGALDGVNESFKQINRFANGKLPLDEELARQLQAARAVSAFVQYGLVLPFAGDAKRITDIKLRQLEELAKDGYYNMPKTYGFVREAINKFNLEPIAPYKTKELTLKNAKGVIQVVKLDEDNLKKINEDAGTIIKTLMNKGDMSNINLGTTLETFNKYNLTPDKIQRSLTIRATQAKKLAVDKFIKENYKGFKKTSKPTEEED